MIRFRHLALFVFLMLAAGSGIAGPVVKSTTSGEVEGQRANGVSVFRGIPFAATTGGDNRWRAPQPLESWRGVRAARQWGPICPQPVRRPFPEGVEIGEDCLNLNLWIPDAAQNQKALPVMVWIHGGGFTHGSGSIHKIFTAGPMPANDFTAFVKNGVIMVTLNYRMGIFGVFGLPDVISPDRDGGRANYGMMDVIVALRWVQTNISSFGGDPNNVTLFGQSAGGSYVSALMASPAAAGLFHKAIIQSGAGAMENGRYLHRETVFAESLETLSARMVETLATGESDDLETALKAMPYQDLLMLTAGAGPMGPVVDGVLLPAPVGEVFRKGRQHDVPLIIGSNSSEGSMLAGRPELLDRLVGAIPADTLDALYGSLDAQQRPIALAGDTLFVAPAWHLARTSAALNQASTHLYHFSYVPSELHELQTGALHGDEMAYAFANLHWRDGVIQVTADDIKLSDSLSAYWTSFAADGDPNGAGLPLWPAQTEQDDVLMRFDKRIGVERRIHGQRMEFHGARINEQLDFTVEVAATPEKSN